MPSTAKDRIAVLWPAFLAACLLEIVVFASFDPHDVRSFGVPELEVQSVYSIAFFGFWMIASLDRKSTRLNSSHT